MSCDWCRTSSAAGSTAHSTASGKRRRSTSGSGTSGTSNNSQDGDVPAGWSAMAA